MAKVRVELVGAGKPPSELVIEEGGSGEVSKGESLGGDSSSVGFFSSFSAEPVIKKLPLLLLLLLVQLLFLPLLPFAWFILK